MRLVVTMCDTNIPAKSGAPQPWIALDQIQMPVRRNIHGLLSLNNR
jgi:hypothetical protein